jgi:nucleoside-diphosphate-sugar epimerase
VVSARDFLDGKQAGLAIHNLVVHAAGPAGETPCVANPGAAFAQHYVLTDLLVDWLQQHLDRHLVLIGTVAPNTGFYGPLKRAAIAHARLRTARPRRLLVVECGQLIGLGVDAKVSGVVGKFVEAAVAGRRPHVAHGGRQTIRYTTLGVLIDILCRVGTEWPASETVSPVSRPVPVVEIAHLCARLAHLLFATPEDVLVDDDDRLSESYEEPTGLVLPGVPELAATLTRWMFEVRAA